MIEGGWRQADSGAGGGRTLIGVPHYAAHGSGGEQAFELGSKLQEIGILNKDTAS